MPKRTDLSVRDYRTARYLSGPLLFVEDVADVCLGEMAAIRLPDGGLRRGQVIEISEKHAVVQVLEETTGMGLSASRIRFSGEVAQMDLSVELLGRRFNGAGIPIDGIPPVEPEIRRPILGRPMNPVSRDKPADFIQTGISTIDGLNTLVRGQKLPIFSGAGLPAKELAVQILRQAKVTDETAEGRFAIVFAAIGIPFRDAAYYLDAFEESGVSDRVVAYLNAADDPTIERLLTPRFALTAAEYLAFDLEYHVLVIMTDMTNYCEALREIATAREEIPGRRGYPGYMYTDLATLYERAGRLYGKPGSVTQLPVVTMPDDDITHPIPDLTGYITEGQIVLSRELHRKNIYPPIDVLPSLSRLMNLGIGKGRTREDHRPLADQLYAFYAQGRELRRLEAIVGKEGLSEPDKRLLAFADRFENEFVRQGSEERELSETLALGWRMISVFSKDRLTRIRRDLIDRYYLEETHGEGHADADESASDQAGDPPRPEGTGSPRK